MKLLKGHLPQAQTIPLKLSKIRTCDGKKPVCWSYLRTYDGKELILTEKSLDVSGA